VELAYNDFSSAQQRNSMLQEFLGPEYRLFKVRLTAVARVGTGGGIPCYDFLQKLFLNSRKYDAGCSFTEDYLKMPRPL
jgi:hypothetical protein